MDANAIITYVIFCTANFISGYFLGYADRENGNVNPWLLIIAEALGIYMQHWRRRYLDL